MPGLCVRPTFARAGTRSEWWGGEERKKDGLSEEKAGVCRDRGVDFGRTRVRDAHPPPPVSVEVTGVARPQETDG